MDRPMDRVTNYCKYMSCSMQLKIAYLLFICLILPFPVSLSLSLPSLVLLYRLVGAKLFGSVFNLHTVFMLGLTAINTPLSVAVTLTFISGAEDFHEHSCVLRPVMEWIWGGSMLIGTFYALLFK